MAHNDLQKFICSTDQGVHSFYNLAHVDLKIKEDGNILPPERILNTLNKYLEKSNISLIINHVEAVPQSFHARFSSFYRHYLYRIGVTDQKKYPIIEWRKCHFIKNPFCIDRASEACKILEGSKNFASFCHGLKKRPPEYPTIRTLDQFSVVPGRPLFNPDYDSSYSGINFYDFHVKASSFMYRQVRRMVAVVIAVAQNRMTIQEVHKLIEKPGEWNSKAVTAPPYGLYLLKVQYKIPEDEQSQRLVEIENGESETGNYPCDLTKRQSSS